MEACEEKRKQLEKLKENRDIETFQKRQHRLKLRKQAKVVQGALEQDKKILGEMLCITAAQEKIEDEKKKKAGEELMWMKNVLERQLEEEKKREKESEMLFAEEAAKMLEKQDEVWKREEMARKRLMEEVVVSWKKQQEEKVEEAREKEKEVLRARGQLSEDVEKLNNWIHEEERSKKEGQKLFVAGLNEARDRAEERRRRLRGEAERDDIENRKEEIREDNRLARCLAEWNLEDAADENGSVEAVRSDFFNLIVKILFCLFLN